MAFSALRARLPHLAGAAAACTGAALAYSLSPLAGPARAERQAEAAAPGALDPKEWKKFKLIEKRPVTHNTLFLRFALPDPEQDVGLPVASCLVVRAPIGSEKEDGSGKKFVIRPYTPCSQPDAKGHFDMVVKVYPDGKMSGHIGGLQVGQELECKGPILKLPYTPNMKKALGFVVGGSGLTPALQVIYKILQNGNDKTEVSLVYANTSEKDIILKAELDDLAKAHKNFQVWYVVDKKENPAFEGSEGYITESVLRQHVPAPSDDSLILVCGPPPMMKAISGEKAEDKSQGELGGLLLKMNYNKDQIFKF